MSADLKDGGMAFPRPATRIEFSSGEVEYYEAIQGMSLRDWYAGQALAGMLAQGTEGTFSKGAGVVRAAVFAYEYADAMLAEREKATHGR